MNNEFIIIDYLLLKLNKTNKIKLSEKLIQYHNDFTQYINNNFNNKFKPEYDNYITLSTPEPSSIEIENAIYDMLENGLTGWENYFFVARHNVQKINYLLFRLNIAYILVYAKYGIIYDFRIIALS